MSIYPCAQPNKDSAECHRRLEKRGENCRVVLMTGAMQVKDGAKPKRRQERQCKGRDKLETRMSEV